LDVKWKIDIMGAQVMNEITSPMQPWPGLAKYARQVALPRNGLTLFMYDSRDPHLPPALLVHGLGDEADTWRHVFEPLSAFYRVIAPDLPGFGRSPGPVGGYTAPFYSSVMLELLQALEITRPILIGHSLGGLLSQAIALQDPQAVAGLVLVAGSLLSRSQKLRFHDLLFMVPGLGERMYNHLRQDPQAAFDSLEPYYHNLSALPRRERDFLFKRVNQRVWSDGQRRAYFSTLRHMVAYALKQQRNLEDRLCNLKTPTLVVWGEDDRIAPVENGRALAQIQPSVRLVLLPHTGHQVQQESPQMLLDAILGDERLNSQKYAS
jgi:pimeloyl-ACP methyl ester carboxylesterase